MVRNKFSIYVKIFWRNLENDPENLLLVFCKLVARHYIYICKLKDNVPKITSFLHEIKYYACIEKEILSNKDFQEKWKPLLLYTVS